MRCRRYILFYFSLLLLPYSLHAVETLDLNDTWKYSTDAAYKESTSWYQQEFDSSSWKDQQIPGNWDTENDNAHFSGSVFYRKTFHVPQSWINAPIRLCFDCVNERADVWMNGQYLGFHQGGYSPFEFNASKYLQPGQSNTLAVCADNSYNRGAWWKWGGFSGGVRLSKENALRIVRQKITATPDLQKKDSAITVDLFIENYSTTPFHGTLVSKIFEGSCPLPRGIQITRSLSLRENTITPLRLVFYLPPEQTKLWDLHTRNIYRLSTSILDKENEIASACDRFGIRKIETRGVKLLLNGTELRLNGFNRIASHRAYGQTEPNQLVKFDIDAMLAMGGRMTRIMHHQQVPYLLDYCDEVGMLLVEEIPVWGKSDPQAFADNPRTKRWLDEMIERDFNHPCIIGWSVGNELADKNQKEQRMGPDVYEYVRSMIEYIKQKDPTRLKTYVSNTALHAKTHGVDPADFCDVIFHNSYCGATWVGRHVHAVWPDKPVFISELGKSQLGESLDNAVLSEKLKEQIVAIRDIDYIVGCSIWSYNDYRSHFNQSAPTENRTWGVYNVWRQPKAAAYEIRSLFTQRENESLLPTLSPIPPKRPENEAFIQAIVPMKNSCVIGFNVVNSEDCYEISIQNSDDEEKTYPIINLQGAVKIDHLIPGTYQFKIRISKKDYHGDWSAVVTAEIN